MPSTRMNGRANNFYLHEYGSLKQATTYADFMKIKEVTKVDIPRSSRAELKMRPAKEPSIFQKRGREVGLEIYSTVTVDRGNGGNKCKRRNG